jgi:hypothetical protein
MMGRMSPPRPLFGGVAATAVRVARSLYGRWRLLPGTERERIAPYAEDAKNKALEVRGTTPGAREEAEADLRAANESLAAAIVESAEADPEIAAEEVAELREDLRRELERLATGEVRASRGPGRGGPPTGEDDIKPSHSRRGPSTPPG